MEGLEEEEEDEEPGKVLEKPAFQLPQEGEKQEDGKPNRPARACKQGYHPYVKTGYTTPQPQTAATAKLQTQARVAAEGGRGQKKPRAGEGNETRGFLFFA